MNITILDGPALAEKVKVSNHLSSCHKMTFATQHQPKSNIDS